jgi:hypothetical protein
LIHAAMRGKIGCLELEDALTAAVFGRLKYLPIRVLADWLALSRAWSADGPSPAILLEGLDTFAPEFWPQWKDVLRGVGIVEPDVAIWANGRLLVIEAKLWSGKSPSAVTAEMERPADQLARQWKAATDLCARTHRNTIGALIYLTAHLTPPSRDLTESIEEMRRCDPQARLHWLSWSALEAPLKKVTDRGEQPQASIATDILSYLDAASVLRFRGWVASNVFEGDLETWKYERSRVRHYFVDTPEISLPTWRYTPRAGKYGFVQSALPGPCWLYQRRAQHGD